MATSWLDLMGDDSNISLASMASVSSLDNTQSKSKFDPDFDNSQQGVNLLLKQKVKFLNSEDSQQSRKRKITELIDLKENECNYYVPPKAKQRTNVQGKWTQRKNEDEEDATTNFSRFLKKSEPITKDTNAVTTMIPAPTTAPAAAAAATPALVAPSPVRTPAAPLSVNINQRNEPKKRRITPTLSKVVFNTELMFNKVPILKKPPKEEESQCIKGPFFLNLDQFQKLQKEKPSEKENEKEKENESPKDIGVGVGVAIAIGKENENKSETENERKSEECAFVSVWAGASDADADEETKKSFSWAHALFASQIENNKKMRKKEEEEMVKDRTRERKHEIEIEQILPPPTDTIADAEASAETEVEAEAEAEADTGASCYKLSRESSLSIPSSSASTNVTTISIVVPSSDATEWRQKQIKIGKETIGYQNYIKRYPNKDLKFRLIHNLVSTPEPKEKIGKKRWVGKYNKWRKFLHRFDE